MIIKCKMTVSIMLTVNYYVKEAGRTDPSLKKIYLYYSLSYDPLRQLNT